MFDTDETSSQRCLAWAPHLQVVLLRLREAHVAGAHQQAPVRQTQVDEHPLGEAVIASSAS
jgi:hypothetical protein